MNKFKIAFILSIFLASSSFAQDKKDKPVGTCCEKKVDSNTSQQEHFSLGNMSKIPNVPLINQYGEHVNLYELVSGKVVALNFIFTTCKTICPPMGANFVHLKKLMDDRIQSSELAMLTISIDPTTDTPERLMAWSEKFEPGSGWTLLTGKKNDINSLLKKLEVYSALKEEHAPIVLLGREGEDNWVRANGLADPKELAKTLNSYFKSPSITSNGGAGLSPPVAYQENPDEQYFTNVELIDQHGNSQQLYKDLLKDKIVIINPFFTACKGVCPVMTNNLAKIQEHLGDKLGKEVHIISLTVDHEADQPEILKTYAESYGAKEGWYFLTGKKENIEFALNKLGKYTENKESHDSIFLVGNLNTKLWKKVNGLAPVEDIIEQIESVINDTVE